MKCTWTAEISRMKGSVQLGLLCLSLLISSLHGEDDADSRMIIPPNFEEPDLHQPQMNRVRRQTVEDSAKEVVDTSSEDGKGPRPGAWTLLEDDKYSEVYRTKRQSKSKNKKKKPRPAYNTLLAKLPDLPKETARVKRDEGAGGKRP